MISGCENGVKNFSDQPRKAMVLRYMPSSSLFDRSKKDRTSANGFKYDFSERPIFLVSGSAKNNELRNSAAKQLFDFNQETFMVFSFVYLT